TQALGALMLRIEHRQLFRPNGLIDDFVLYGKRIDYVAFARKVEAVIDGGGTETLCTESGIHVEILSVAGRNELCTSLQNQGDVYPSMDDWQKRNILRVSGSAVVLERLRHFLVDLSGRGEGYSYISEYSEESPYSIDSPEWRLHVQAT
ncbi:MAG: hypothetical protein ABL859_09710, partial [Methylotenera sp.]